jgi:hypothetical protein
MSFDERSATMTRVWMYILGASKDRNHVVCPVPKKVDRRQIFFGPCEKLMRKKLRDEYLTVEEPYRRVERDDLFVVGLNGSNDKRERKVVWAGKLSEVMTFAEADKRLVGQRYAHLREDTNRSPSPLHVRPVMKDGKYGYEHWGWEHKGRQKGKPHDMWVYDFVSDPTGFEINNKNGFETEILRKSPTQDFDRDCCMLLDCLFFAEGQGIDIDEEVVEILKERQRGQSGIDAIDSYAVFGKDDLGRAKGRAIVKCCG